jgi:acyl-CoA thioesterase FadM
MKNVVITFFDIMGTVHFEFIPQGQIVNQAYYVEMMKRLREAVHTERPEIWLND